MEKENKPTEKKMEEKPTEKKIKEKVVDKKVEAQVKDGNNTDSNKQKEKKKEAPKIEKKDEAIANGLGLHASKRHCMYICSFIKNKTIDRAMKELGEVIAMKRAIPFKGEIPHRKGDMMSGRYPVKAAGMFISMLKGLKGNVLVNQMDLDKTRIAIASASWAYRPARSGGRRAKRTNVILIAREKTKEKKQ